MKIYSSNVTITDVGVFTFQIQRYTPDINPEIPQQIPPMFIAWKGDICGTGDTIVEAILNCCEKWLAKEAQS